MAFTPSSRARLQASCACAGTAAIWCWRGGPVAAAIAGLAAALALLAWISPAGYAPVQRTLERVLHLLLAALTWMLLGVVFVLVFIPLRAVRSLTGRDPLRRRPDPAAASYLQPLPPGQGEFDRQF